VDPLARDIFKELIEINTTDSSGTTKAAEAVAARLRAGGFAAADVRVLGPDPRKANLVARYLGTGGRRPLLLLAHLDVVEARREDWSFDPFTFLERDGYVYGRGTSDMKDMAACWIANLLELKRQGYQPDRDIILALTADEETGHANGADFRMAGIPTDGLGAFEDVDDARAHGRDERIGVRQFYEEREFLCPAD
jgi:acetylornithine deacetylase/succinyl-diaminopimelate desuccinylase-like protein